MKRDERGFAMLLVFALAASASLLLYMQVPRIAFEAQRNQEQLLIERGEEYKRAIQLFVRKEGRYPATLDELENLNNRRYLRRRYADPFTGKTDWRIVHIQNGVFTDSLLHKNDTKEGEQKNQNTFISEFAGVGQTNTTDGGPNAATRRRQSEGGVSTGGVEVPGTTVDAPTAAPGMFSQYPATQPGQPGAPPQPGQPQMPPGVPGMPGMTGVVPGQNLPGQPMPGQPGQVVPGQPYPVQQPGQPNSVQAGQPYQMAPVQPGQPFPNVANPALPGSQPGVPTSPGTATMFPGAPQAAQMAGNNGAPMGGNNPAAMGDNNAAADMIRRMLTQPRPGGPPAQSGMMGMNMNGIAGVASTVERTGIKIYAERDKYNEWEFLYDLTQDRKRAGAMAQAMGQQTGGGNQPTQPQNSFGGGQPPPGPGQPPPLGPGQPPPFPSSPGFPPPFGAQPQIPNRTR